MSKITYNNNEHCQWYEVDGVKFEFPYNNSVAEKIVKKKAVLFDSAPELLKAAIVGLIHMKDVSKAYPIPRSIPQSEIDFVKNIIAKAEEGDDEIYEKTKR